jgi:hypothetical protein
MDLTEEKFRNLNPERTGHDDEGACYVCGCDETVGGYVFCEPHLVDFKANKHKLPNPWMLWVVGHPDFNGIDFNGRRARHYIYPQRPTAEQMYETLRARG